MAGKSKSISRIFFVNFITHHVMSHATRDSARATTYSMRNFHCDRLQICAHVLSQGARSLRREVDERTSGGNQSRQSTAGARSVRAAQRKVMSTHRSESPPSVLPASLTGSTLARCSGRLCDRHWRLVPIHLDVLHVLAGHHYPPDVALVLLAELLTCNTEAIRRDPRFGMQSTNRIRPST